jgi:hypothetical protein
MCSRLGAACLMCSPACVPRCPVCSPLMPERPPSSLSLSLSLFHSSSTSWSLVHHGRAEQSSLRCLLLPLSAILAPLRTCLATLLSHRAGALADSLLPWSATGAAAARGQAPKWSGHRRPACCSSRTGPGLQRGRGWLSFYHGRPLPRHWRAPAGRIGRPLSSALRTRWRRGRIAGLNSKKGRGWGVKLKTHVNSSMGTSLLGSIKVYCRGLNEELVTQLNSVA